MNIKIFLFSLFFLSSVFGKEWTFEFEGTPLLVKESNNGYWTELKVFDPGDSVLWPKALPFLFLTFYKDREGCLDTLTKTNSLTGGQSIELAKELARQYGIEKLELTDAAITLQCKGEGTFCHDEPLIPLRILGIFKSGKGFYESRGALSDDFILYRAAADFLHLSLVTQDLLEDLAQLEEEIPEATTLSEVIQTALAKTEAKKTIPLAELYKKVAEVAFKDCESHEEWHRFINQIVLREKTIFLEVARGVYTHQKAYDPRLLRVLSMYITSYLKKTKTLCGMRSLPEERFIPLFTKESFLQELLIARMEPADSSDDEEDDLSSLDWTMHKRASLESYKRTFLSTLFPLRSPLLGELYFEALCYLKPSPPLRSDLFVEFETQDFLSLVQEYPFPDMPAKEGHLYLLFELAKAIIDDSSDFTFILNH